MGGAEVQAAFLAQPDKARDAIQLAVRLVKEQGGGGGGVAASAPGAMSMHRPVAQMGGSLKQRLDVLGRLVARGVLTQVRVRLVLALGGGAPLWLHLLLRLHLPPGWGPGATGWTTRGPPPQQLRVGTVASPCRAADAEARAG